MTPLLTGFIIHVYHIERRENVSGKYTLAQLRVGKRWSQQEAANALGVSQGSWFKWENGISYPTQPNVDKILRVFDVKYDDVIF